MEPGQLQHQILPISPMIISPFEAHDIKRPGLYSGTVRKILFRNLIYQKEEEAWCVAVYSKQCELAGDTPRQFHRWNCVSTCKHSIGTTRPGGKCDLDAALFWSTGTGQIGIDQ